MSENLDLVRSICAPWERGDFSRAEWAHPEIEFVTADGLTPGSCGGPAAMAETFASGNLSAWEDARFLVDEYSEVDPERILVLAHYSGRGKTSGVDLGQMRTKAAHVFHLREGKVTKIIVYSDCGRALGDLGLAPETGERE